MARALLVLAFLTLLIGTGAADAWDAADTHLEIEIQAVPEGPITRYTLDCNPPAGTVRDPVAACARIADQLAEAASQSNVQSPRKDQHEWDAPTIVCPLLYGGPEVAHLRGRMAGGPVDGRLTREDGCSAPAYDATMRLLSLPQ